ncbi:MAG: DUF3037 domain-containing protein [Tepidisphaeraceae bacterium]|jgi:hypothetical protein
MKPMRGYYSIIQYCPDASRAEAANVGVLLFCPEAGFVEARTSVGNDRIRRFFGDRPFDKRQINSAKRAIEERLKSDREHFKTLDDLEHFIATRANEIVLTSPRPLKVFDPVKDLEQLFGELVGGRARWASDLPPLLPELDRVFRSPSLEGKIQFDQKVTIPIVNRPMKVPYSYQNGILNYVKPEVYASDAGRASALAERLAIEGDLLHRTPTSEGIKRQLIVVVKVQLFAGSGDLIQMMKKLYEAYSVRMIRAEEIDEFGREVESQAH